MANQFKQQGLGCVAGNDDRAVHTTAQKAGARGEAEVAAMIGAAVAAIAMAFKDGLDALRVEGDGSGSRLRFRCDTARLPKGSGRCEYESAECEREHAAVEAEGLEPISGRLVASHETNLRDASMVREGDELPKQEKLNSPSSKCGGG